jgi:hypothetical protein
MEVGKIHLRSRGDIRKRFMYWFEHALTNPLKRFGQEREDIAIGDVKFGIEGKMAFYVRVEGARVVKSTLREMRGQEIRMTTA